MKKEEKEKAKKVLELASKMSGQEKDVFISFGQGMVLMKERQEREEEADAKSTDGKEQPL